MNRHLNVMHQNLKKPKKKVRKSKPHKKHPKRPIAAVLTGAVLPREVEREIIVEGKTFELTLPELSREVEALKSDSETEVPVEEINLDVREDSGVRTRDSSSVISEEASPNCEVLDILEADLDKIEFVIESESVSFSSQNVATPETQGSGKMNILVLTEDGETSREISSIVIRETPVNEDVVDTLSTDVEVESDRALNGVDINPKIVGSS